MEKVAPNLYRMTGKRASKGRAFAYLIVREAGNLLLPRAGVPVMEYVDEIDEMGGVATQFLTHRHDVDGAQHDVIYERFGARLACHRAERWKVAPKTSCPIDVFDDEGLLVDDDFQALYFPSCTHGLCLYHWRHRDTNYLFTSHVATVTEGAWRVDLQPAKAFTERRAQLSELMKLPLDVALPSLARDGQQPMHRFDEASRAAFRRQLQARIQLSPGGLKSEGQGRILLNYNLAGRHVEAVIDSTDLFDRVRLETHGNCRMDVLLRYVEGADVMLFHNFLRRLGPKDLLIPALRQHVEAGGGVLVTDARTEVDSRWLVARDPFAEVAAHGPESSGVHRLSTIAPHPALGELPASTRFTTSAYTGMTLQPGALGEVLVVNGSGQPVVVCGTMGGGRVVQACFEYESNQPLGVADSQLLIGLLRWVVRQDGQV